MIGPPSSWEVTRWTVAPDTRTPWVRACRCASSPGNAGRSEGWIFRIRSGNAASIGAPTSRMKPARQTRSTRASRSSATSAASYASRSGRSRAASTPVSIPASRARCKPGTSARLEITRARSAFRRPSAMASMIDWRLDPRPEISTPSRRLDVDHLSRARDDGPDPDRVGFAVASQGVDDSLGFAWRTNENQPDPHVERAKHLVSGNVAALLQQPKQRWRAPGAEIDLGTAPFGQHARKVLGDAASGDMRQPFEQLTRH